MSFLERFDGDLADKLELAHNWLGSFLPGFVVALVRWLVDKQPVVLLIECGVTSDGVPKLLGVLTTAGLAVSPDGDGLASSLCF